MFGKCRTCEARQEEVEYLREQVSELLDRLQARDWAQFKSATEYEKEKETFSVDPETHAFRDPLGVNLVESWEEPSRSPSESDDESSFHEF